MSTTTPRESITPFFMPPLYPQHNSTAAFLTDLKLFSIIGFHCYMKPLQGMEHVLFIYVFPNLPK